MTRGINDEAVLNLTDLNFFAGISLSAYNYTNKDWYTNDSIYEYFSVVNDYSSQPNFLMCPNLALNFTDLEIPPPLCLQ